MNLNSIYAAFQGEANPFGIGEPVIFVRLAGCPIRCYWKTLGVLCDTPEALSKKSGETLKPAEIAHRAHQVAEEAGGIKLICLSGGDPLWWPELEVNDLLSNLLWKRFSVCVETSGVIDPSPYYRFNNTYFIMDWKLKSAGIKGNKMESIAPTLRENDYIKFVVYDWDDYQEMFNIVQDLKTSAKSVAGVYWNGTIDSFELFNQLKKDKLLGKIAMNFQVHKLAYPDYELIQPKMI
jgi:7-carboxy-7-deazaguanine synthase